MVGIEWVLQTDSMGAFSLSLAGGLTFVYYKNMRKKRTKKQWKLKQKARGMRFRGAGMRLSGSGMRLSGSGMRLSGSGMTMTGSGMTMTGSGLKARHPRRHR